MPTYWKGHNIVHFAASKKHIGLYPGPAAVEKFAEALKGYKTDKGTIRIPYGKVDAELIIDKKNCLVVLRNRKPCMRRNIMNQIEEIIRNTTEEEQEKVDWTKAWSTKYPVLATYQKEVDIPKYATEIRRMFTELQEDYNYSEQDAMLVLKDILAHEYMDNRPKKNKKHK